MADVMNQRNLGALDDLYTPRLAPASGDAVPAS
jgi:hypothetical protein